MAMNNKGQVGIIWGIMIFLFIMVLALTLQPSMRSIITGARTDLSCGTDDLTTGEAFSCVFIDVLQFVFLIVLLMGGLALVISNLNAGV